jgi:hypothetical protein
MTVLKPRISTQNLKKEQGSLLLCFDKNVCPLLHVWYQTVDLKLTRPLLTVGWSTLIKTSAHCSIAETSVGLTPAVGGILAASLEGAQAGHLGAHLTVLKGG